MLVGHFLCLMFVCVASTSQFFLLDFCQEAPAAVDDDDDLDLFGDETEEEKKAAEQRDAAKASTKKKESKFCFHIDVCTCLLLLLFKIFKALRIVRLILTKIEKFGGRDN